MYLIKKTKRTNGIYLILNVLKKKAYIGLAKNLSNRTLDHIIAICNYDNTDNGYTKYLDNKNLLNENDKEFIHFPIFETDNKLEDHYINNLESAFIIAVRDHLSNGDEKKDVLYNTAKRNYSKNNLSVDVDWDCINCSLDDSFNDAIGMTFKEYCDLNAEDCMLLWEKLEKEDEKENWYKLKMKSDKEDENNYSYANDRKYSELLHDLESFKFSKSKISDIGIDWESKSIKDLSNEDFIVVEYFGIHNNEVPYEILLKMKMDLDNSEDEHYYWACAKNLKILEKVKEYKTIKCDGEWPPIYAIFKTTTSNNSATLAERKEKVRDMEKVLTRQEIEEEDERLKKENPLSLKHSFYDENKESWTFLPKGHTYITIASGNNRGIEFKTSALKVGKCWICEESDINGIIDKGNQNAYFSSIHIENLQESIGASDDTACIIARLDYPYIVELSHSSGLRDYLSGNNDRVILELDYNKKITEKTKITGGYAFNNNNVRFLDWENFNTQSINIKEDKAVDIAKKIDVNSKKGTFKVVRENDHEMIKMEFDDGIERIISFDCTQKLKKVTSNKIYKYSEQDIKEGIAGTYTVTYWSLESDNDKNHKTKYIFCVDNIFSSGEGQDKKIPFLFDEE